MPHYATLADRTDPGVGFFEIIAENFLGPSAVAARHLARARDLAPVVVHGVSLNLLGPEPLDRDHVRALKALADRLDAPYVTEHLCWTATGAHNLHDLLPAPMTLGLAAYAAERARIVQDILERPFGLENLSPMVALTASTEPEWSFYADVVHAAGCGFLFDVNNIHVSALNTGVDPLAFIDAVDPARVLQVHLAGHRRPPVGPVADTHDAPVVDEVWALYREAWRRLGPFPTLLEWDDRIPPYEACLAEIGRSAGVRASVSPAPRAGARARGALAPRSAPPDDAVQWQRSFAALVTRPLLFAPPRARARTEDYPDAVVRAVAPTARVAPVDGLRAYHEQYWFRLLAALQTSWPTLSALMGPWTFNQLATAFLEVHPPAGRDLGDAGLGLDAFLAGSAWDQPPWREAAAVDRTWSELLALGAVPTWRPGGPDLATRRLVPSPALRRLSLRWPMPLVRDAAAAHQGEAPMPLPAPEPGTWLLFRTPDLELARFRADPLLARLLDHLDTLPLAGAVDQLARGLADEGVPVDAALTSRVRRWFDAGVRWGWWTGTEAPP